MIIPECVDVIDSIMMLPPGRERDSRVDLLLAHFDCLYDDVRNANVHYLECRLKGTPHGLAEMFALAQPPQSQTDVEFLRGSDQQFSQGPLAEKMGNYYKQVAEEGGQCTKGKVYKSGLALYPGDPRAWVSDRHEVQKVVEERNWGCRGSVENKSDGSRESA